MVGTLNIDTAPENAKIFIDGVDTLKITPSQFILPSGIHNYIVTLQGFVTIGGQVYIADGETTNMIITLQSDSVVLYKYLLTIGMVGVGISALSLLFGKRTYAYTKR